MRPIHELRRLLKGGGGRHPFDVARHDIGNDHEPLMRPEAFGSLAATCCGALRNGPRIQLVYIYWEIAGCWMTETKIHITRRDVLVTGAALVAVTGSGGLGRALSGAGGGSEPAGPAGQPFGERRQASALARSTHHLARRLARSFAAHRHKERLRSWPVRRLHRVGERGAQKRLPVACDHALGRRDHDHRRAGTLRRTCIRCRWLLSSMTVSNAASVRPKAKSVSAAGMMAEARNGMPSAATEDLCPAQQASLTPVEIRERIRAAISVAARPIPISSRRSAMSPKDIWDESFHLCSARPTPRAQPLPPASGRPADRRRNKSSRPDEGRGRDARRILVDISRLPMAEIAGTDGGGLRIGAAVTNADPRGGQARARKLSHVVARPAQRGIGAIAQPG